MEQLEQLRTMRDEARLRIAATADYKLATSLDALIADLEKVLGIDASDEETTGDVADDVEPEPVEPEPVEVEASPSAPQEDDETDETSSEDDDTGVSDLTQALAEQLERETRSAHDSTEQDEDEALSHSSSGNGSAEVEEPEDMSEEDALIRAMRELDEDLAKADLGGKTESSK